MHWELIIPVLLFVWMVVSLIRKTDEERRGRTQKSSERERTAERQRSRPAGEIDRFLEEVNRRRQSAERRPKPSPEAKSRPVRQRSVPVAPAVRPEPRRPLTPPAEAVVAVAVPAALPVNNLQWPWQEPGTVKRASPSAPPTNALEQVVALLRSPQSVSAAVILREILDAPLCRRRL